MQAAVNSESVYDLSADIISSAYLRICAIFIILYI